jgi:hypothetical protein
LSPLIIAKSSRHIVLIETPQLTCHRSPWPKRPGRLARVPMKRPKDCLLWLRPAAAAMREAIPVKSQI